MVRVLRVWFIVCFACASCVLRFVCVFGGMGQWGTRPSASPLRHFTMPLPSKLQQIPRTDLPPRKKKKEVPKPRPAKQAWDLRLSSSDEEGDAEFETKVDGADVESRGGGWRGQGWR